MKNSSCWLQRLALLYRDSMTRGSIAFLLSTVDSLPYKGKRGFLLITSLGVVVFLTLAGVLLLVRGIWQTNASERLYQRSNTLHLAEAAVGQAARNLISPSTVDDIASASLSTGNFQIDPPLSLGNQIYQVTTRGTSEGEERRLEVVFRLIPKSIFQFALFGDQGVDVSGNAITDSYDSSLGPYNDDPTSPDYNAGHNGDVGTNESTDNSVEVGGSIFIDGQVAVGYEADDPYAVIDGYDPAFITGGTDPPSDTQDIVTQDAAFPMPQVTVPLGLAASCTDSTISSNTTETLSPTGGPNGDGVYCYRNLTIQGGGTLTTSGSVTVYLTGQFIAIGNSLMGVPSDPTQMLVLMTPTGDATLEQGTFTGSTGFYGVLYGPESNIRITGNAEIFGSIIARSIDVQGSASIHYDEAVGRMNQITNTFSVTRIAWREL